MKKLKPLLRQPCKACQKINNDECEHRRFSKMDYGLLCDWIAYYWNRGTISYLLDGEEARGVCLIKLFRRLEQFLEPFVHEPGGRFCMIELLVAKDPKALAHTCFELHAHWGQPEIMMWDRGERTEGGTPRMYTWKDYQKLTRRLTGLTNTERKAEYG